MISLDCGMRARMLPNILENCVAIAATAASRAFFLCASCSILDAERALSGPLWASLGARAARRRAGAAGSQDSQDRVGHLYQDSQDSQDELRLYSSYDSTSSTAYMVIIYCKFGNGSQSFRLLAQWLVHYMQWWKVTRTSPGLLPGYFFCSQTIFLGSLPRYIFWAPKLPLLPRYP